MLDDDDESIPEHPDDENHDPRTTISLDDAIRRRCRESKAFAEWYSQLPLLQIYIVAT